MASAIGIQFLPKEVQTRKDLNIRSGDTVSVTLKIQEKDKVRLQKFEGIVLARKHGAEAGGTFTVRKVTSGVGVERIFPLYSPMIEKIEIIRRVNTRRAKLYFIREKVARDIRRKLRNFVDFFASSSDLIVPSEEMIDEVVEEAKIAEVAPETSSIIPEEQQVIENSSEKN
ncbi:50S ribosomal protein L19 [Candidatus Nomurabacteria bacterium RIFCSPLOWO2_01_FULL_36_10b]|uniref:50S ribosomal protein L19 n=1 Tax=Candidatus Nomurabacteria bacterium RIFCSPLOWO2_01_FULL_36_10b TaxID=1801766 RepID=A0A1F6WP22_9BACT|nr:MAG: 50S ribosomal protein L19 [Candidatus Nomurabacteria bacterium RIFCSPLOWO2_01_FULL_36_10b]